MATIQQVSSTFRKTAAATKLGRMLFDPAQQLKISPTQITQLLKAAGVNVPKGVVIAADSAQIILAGGAFVSAVERGASIRAICVPSAQIIGATTDLLGVLGIADPQSPGMQLLRLGTDSALVIATGGMNLLADLALVMDFVVGIGQPDDRPQAHLDLAKKASQDAQAWFNARENAQSANAARIFQTYQNGKISTFQMLGSLAAKSPDLFYNYFPDFGTFIPPITISKTFTESKNAEYGGFFGIDRQKEKVSESATISFQSIKNDYKTVASAFINKYLLHPFWPYRALGCNEISVRTSGFPLKAQKLGVYSHPNPVSPRISLMDMAVLSMLPPYFDYLHDDFDIRQYLQSLSISPSDMGYSSEFFASQMEAGDLSKVETHANPAITFNGVDYFSSTDSTKNQQVDLNNEEINRARQLYADGKIDELLHIPRANKVIAEWGIIPYIPRQQESVSSSATNPNGYRNIRNYWGAINLMEYMTSDPYFTKGNPGLDLFREVKQFLPTSDEINRRHRELQFLSVARKMNVSALGNIASFFGMKPEKLQMLPAEPGKLAKVKLG